MRTAKRKLWLVALLAAFLGAIFALVACGGTDSGSVGGSTSEESNGGSVEQTKFTVTFELCTELKTNTILPRKAEKGDRITAPQVYVSEDNPENYFIEGWYTEAEYINEWDFYFDEVEGDMTLYAKWKSDPKYNVNFIAAGDDMPTFTAEVKKGLKVAECDDRFAGREVLGYYTDETLTSEFDFESGITADTNIYVKLSDYVYFSPKYLLTFSTRNASSALSANGDLDISYTQRDNYIYKSGLGLDLGGNELIEIVYKLDGGTRVDIYWFATDSNGAGVGGQTNFNEVTKNCGLSSHYTEVYTDEDGWTHAVYDLTKPRAYVDGKIKSPLKDIATLQGFRIDVDGETKDPAVLTVKYVKGKAKPPKTGFDVNYYIGEDAVLTETVDSGEKATMPADASVVTGRKVIGYYTDPDFETEYDFDAAITEDTDIYVKLSDYFYLDGAMLAKFGAVSGATCKLNADGTLSMKGGNGAFIYRKNLGIALGETDAIEIKAKVSLSGGRVDIWAFGKYTLDGVAGENTDYGQAYTSYYGVGAGCTISAADENGYVTIKFDLSLPASNKDGKAFAYTVLEGFRIDIVGGNAETNEVIIESVKSVVNVSAYRVNYFVGSELKGTADVEKGGVAPALSDDKVAFGKQILGYYTDEALTEEFDLTTAIVKNTNLYSNFPIICI